GSKKLTLVEIATTAHTTADDYIQVTMIAQDLDFSRHKLNMYVTAVPFGKYAHTGRLQTELRVSVAGNFGSKNVDFKAGRKMKAVDLAVPLIGYPRMYPFDDYETALDIMLTDSSLSSNDTDDGSDVDDTIPLRLQFYGTIQSLNLHPKLTTYAEAPNVVLMGLAITRSRISLVFSIFIMIVMWAMALTVTVLSFQILVNRRQVGDPLITVGATMLFALPALRNSQPGIPTLGCASDILSFFWCLFMIAAAAITNILTLVLRWKYRGPSWLDSKSLLSTGSNASSNRPMSSQSDATAITVRGSVAASDTIKPSATTSDQFNQLGRYRVSSFSSSITTHPHAVGQGSPARRGRYESSDISDLYAIHQPSPYPERYYLRH
ncbi:hypothetical protein H4R34_001355, partial [Dimargaris verticillata]